jgi:plasmid maintenance system antidote protein VapI
MLGEQMDDNEILRRLRKVRYGSARERYARRALSINAIAVQAGYSREYVHRIIAGTVPLSPAAAERLNHVLKLVTERGW